MYGRDIRNRSEENSRCMTNINIVERYIKKDPSTTKCNRSIKTHH